MLPRLERGLALEREQQREVRKVIRVVKSPWNEYILSFLQCFQTLISSFKVLLVGLYKDQDSPLHLLRAPNNVVQDVMPIIWKMLKNKWQVVKDILFWNFSDIHDISHDIDSI